MSILKLIFLYVTILWLAACHSNESPVSKNKINRINLLFEGEVKKDNYLPAVISIDSQGIYEGKVKRRGGYSIRYPKHSYEIDLKDNVSLGGMPADDDWILNANYIDKTFLRHVLSYQLFREMSTENIASQTRFVDLYLNDVYNGLYVLMQKLDASSLKLNTKDPESFIFKEPPFFIEDYSNLTPQKEGNFYQQVFPKINAKNLNSQLEVIRNIILNNDDKSFTTSIQKIFNIDNIIDWHLLLLLSNNNDGIVKNFYLYKKGKNYPIEIAPWDYDHSFGRDGDNELNLDQRHLNINKSILFERLLEFDWYKKKLKARWRIHNKKNILSTKGLHLKIDNLFKNIENSVERNSNKWSPKSKWYYDDNSARKEIEIMHQFINLRHDRLTLYFEQI